MKYMKKNIKHIVILFLVFVSVFSLFKAVSVLAGEKVIKLTDAQISEKSSTTQALIESFSDEVINSKTTFYKIDDYVVYKLTIKNTSSKDYTLVSVSDNNQDTNLSYEYTYDANSNFASNTTKDITLKISYKTELTDVSKRDQDNNIKITINLASEDGESSEEEIIINPKTNDSIMLYVILFAVSTGILVFLIIKNRKTKVIVITLVATIPFIAKASFVGVVLNFNTDLALRDKLVVTYDINGTTVTDVVPYDSLVTKPSDPVVNGYTFEGWYKGSELFDFDNDKLSEDETITAKLSLIDYTITLDLAGGSGTSSYTYNVETSSFTLAHPTKGAYNFIGWTGEDITEPVYDLTISTGTYGNKSYTANYAPRNDTPYTVIHKYQNLDGTYTSNTVNSTGVTGSPVTIDPDCKHGFSCPTPEVLVIGADGQSSLTYTYDREYYTLTVNEDVDTTFINPSYLFETPITVSYKNKTGYTFSKWSDNATDNPYTFTLNDNTQITPVYTPNNYTVTFNSNNELAETSTQDFVYDTSANLNANSFIYPGYTFSKWNSLENGLGSNYSNEANVINLATSGNVNLYAIWTANTETLYTVIHRYEKLDGTFEEVYVDGHGTTATSVDAELLPRNGFDTPALDQVYIKGDGSGSHTYTYLRTYYTLTVNEDVETTFTEPSYKYGTSITVVAKDKDGYTFSKWSNNSTAKTTTFEIAGDTNIYPIYEANKYNVVFNSNTDPNQTSSQEFTYDTAANLNANAFSYPGHTFVEWNTQSDGLGTTYSNQAEVNNLATSGNFNLYAIWSTDSYEVTFDSRGGTSVSSITREYNEALGELATPKKTGFIFAGWYTDPDNGTEVSENTLVTGTVTYYAHWDEQEILCKKSQVLHTQECNSANNKGCKLMGFTATGPMGTTTITYGQVAYNYTPGDVYNCDVNGDGVYSDTDERFYYIRTENNKAVLIYNANFDDTGNVNNSVIYDFDTSRSILPTSSIWSNVPEISDGVITRFPNMDDINAACPECNSATNYSLSNCLFLLENTKFANSADQYGRSAIWMEPIIENGETILKRYRGDTYNLQSVDATSSSGVRPVILVPLENMDTAVTVKFDLNGGTGDDDLRIIPDVTAVGTLPNDPSKQKAIFEGWFTDPVNGEQINENTVPVGDVTYYAHFSNTIAAAIIPNETIIVLPGGSEQINITNADEIDEAYTFAPADDGVATVDSNGNVTGVSVGHTNVIITGLRSGETRIITVHVISDTSSYVVNFDTNGGNIIDPITVHEGDTLGTLPIPEKSGNYFDAWYLDPEFNNLVDENMVVTETMTLYAKWYSVNSVAKIGHEYYTDIKSAVEAVPFNDTRTEITILKSFEYAQQTEIFDHQIVDINLNGYTYTFKGTGSVNVFKVTGGELYLSGGTITTGATSGMIDVADGKVLYIDGGTYRATNTKQVIYNNGGTTTITGGAILSSTAKERATVHNLGNGTMYIIDATITSTGSSTTNVANASHGVRNESGTIYIGEEGGVPSTTSPSIQGNSSGVYGSGVYFYDGIVKGKTNSFSSMPNTAHIQSGTQIITGTDGNYNTATLGVSGYVITLNPNGGETTPTVLTVTPGDALTNLPTPTRENHHFDGWFTSAEGGDEVTNETIPDGSAEYFAHWTYVSSDEIVSFRTTNDAMKTYYAKIDDWKVSSANFPSWSDNNKSPNWALDATENTEMMQNFIANNCMCADNQCSSSGTVECDKPKGYSTGFSESVTVRLSDASTKTKTGEIVKYAKSSNGVIYNLIPDQVYYWELDSDSSIYGYVKFTGERRVIDAGDVRNVRDLGGLPVDSDNDTIIDGYLDYGRLFRGIRLPSSSSVTELKNLGVDSELDLREANSDTNKIDRYNRIEAQNYYVRYGTTNPNESTYYTMTRNAVKYAMEEIVAGRNLYFHCRIGTDRTGTVAYVLEGLLNVPEEYRIEDYELSFFYGLVRIHRYHDGKPGSSVGTGKERFVYMHNFMPTNADIYNWYMAGSTDVNADTTLINQFRTAMIK